MTAVLLINLGTPSAPTPAAVKRYLREFLLDPRVVELPRYLWQPLLESLILPIRSRRSAKLYQNIWQPLGSPLLIYTQALAKQLQQHLQPDNLSVVVGMRYGRPSIAEALTSLQQQKVKKIICLPLYPQYSAATTASCFDEVTRVIKQWRTVPSLHFINHYHRHPHYIHAIAEQIKQHRQQHGSAEKLIFSFHGLPQRHVDLGDPYQQQCQKTVKLVAKALSLADKHYTLCFQSRFGPAKWLMPYTTETLIQLAQQGTQSVDIICPGFAVDCLETLEEIAITLKTLFTQAGGKHYRYIPALNDTAAHSQLLATLIQPSMAPQC